MGSWVFAVLLWNLGFQRRDLVVLKQDRTKQLSMGVSVSSKDTRVGSSGHYQEATDTE